MLGSFNKAIQLIKKHFASYQNAFDGIIYLFKEVNFWAEILIGMVLVSTYLVLHIKLIFALFWFVLWILLIAFEAFNTSIEWLCDFLVTNKDSKIKIVKDLGALATLIVALGLLIMYFVGIYASIV